MNGNKINAMFYAESYHPIQAGSIDGTDILPHDNAIYRAHLCASAGLYDPFGDPKVIGDPYCTVFVGRLSRHTSEDSLCEAMSEYGRVKNLRLVRHIGFIDPNHQLFGRAFGAMIHPKALIPKHPTFIPRDGASWMECIIKKQEAECIVKQQAYQL